MHEKANFILYNLKIWMAWKNKYSLRCVLNYVISEALKCTELHLRVNFCNFEILIQIYLDAVNVHFYFFFHG